MRPKQKLSSKLELYLHLLILVWLPLLFLNLLRPPTTALIPRTTAVQIITEEDVDEDEEFERKACICLIPT
jgi:hypothetical protein